MTTITINDDGSLRGASARVMMATAALNVAIEAAASAGLRVEANVMDAGSADFRIRCPRIRTATSIMLDAPVWAYATGDERPSP